MKLPYLTLARLLPTILLTSLALTGCRDEGTGGAGGTGGDGAGGSGAGGSSGTSTGCGDGIVEGDEACDGDTGDETCVTQGFVSGTLSCSATCELDTSACISAAECGNGEAEQGEACDGQDLADATCLSEGFASGDLLCAADCTLDTSDCVAVEIECGNDVVEQGEACDGVALDGATCQGEGFAGGTLACNDDCTLDTSGCTDCGNDVIDGGEECDGLELGDQTCGDLGFDAGNLACNDDCTFDDSGCVTITCGNSMLDAGEDCDGALLGGGTCVTEGFDGGVLSCANNCVYDTAACTTCGDGVAEGNEDCDGADLAGQGCTDLGFVSGQLGCSMACAYDTSACSSVPFPVAGDVVITEIMQNPGALADNVGEWFEVRNTSAVNLQLGGCTVEGAGVGETATIMGDLQLGAGAHATFARTATPGFTPTYVYGSAISLTNTSDTIRLACNGVTIDEVVYGATFPTVDGESMSLDPAATDDALNDAGTSWCAATTTSPGFTSGDLGTPNEANPPCNPNPPLTIGFCRLQFPTSIDGVAGSMSPVVFGRVYVAGLTDMTDGNDPAMNLVGEVGYGADGSDPAAGGWTWTAAVPNPGWSGSAAGEANNDEYQASFGLPPAAGSPYDFAYRFSGDGGVTWTYCDGGAAGSSDGYAAANAGALTTSPAGGPNLWINEIHYDDAGGDADEGVEIAGPAGTDLTGYSVVPYNGGTGMSYTPGATLTGMIPNQQGGFGTLWFPIPGLQNGAPDGIALVGPGNTVIQFLCYEGTFMALNGPASGQTCVDIVASEEPAPVDGLSLQLIGMGSAAAAFTWTGPVAHSRGLVNVGQTFQ